MLANFAEAILRPINTTVTILLGIYTVAWGGWLLGPWNSFASAHIYTKMASIAPERYWGAEAMLFGLLICYGSWRGSRPILLRGTIFTGLHWSAVALLLCIGDWRNPGWLTYSFVSAYAGFISLNLSANHHARRAGDGSP